MEIKKDTKKELHLEFTEYGHTFCNLLKKELYKDENIDAASYKISHPLVKSTEFIIMTNGKEEPRNAIKKAIKNIKSENTRMEKEVNKVLK